MSSVAFGFIQPQVSAVCSSYRVLLIMLKDIYQQMMNFRMRHLLIFVALLVVVSYLYYPTTNYAFLDGWDDPEYITENPKIRSLAPGNLVRIFTSFDMGNYAPVHILSHAVEYYFFGMDPFGYRFVNVALHFLNSILVFLLVRRICSQDMIALLVALFFIVHPLQVESVAWISQRKNLLSTFFMLLSFIFFMGYRSTERVSHYRASLILFIVALLSKISVVVLPVYMLMYDFFIYGKITKERFFGDYLYFALASITMVVITLVAQGAGVGIRTEHYVNSFVETLLIPPALWSSYLGTLIVPVNLSALYDEHVVLQFLSWKAFVGVAAFGIVVAMLTQWKKSGYREQLFWGGWFFAGILPVSHLIPMVTIMNDRYVYFPMIGFAAFIITPIFNVLLSPEAKFIRAKRLIVIAFLLIALGVYGWMSKERIPVWKDSCTLWSDAVKKYPNQAKAHNNLGACYETQRDLVRAELEYKKAAEIKPDLFVARYNLGKIYGQMKRYHSAIDEFRLAEQVLPNDPAIHYYLGLAYKMNGQPELAIQQFRKDLIISPNKIKSTRELLGLYVELGQYKEAASLIEEIRERKGGNSNIEPFLEKMERKIQKKRKIGHTLGDNEPDGILEDEWRVG